MEPGDDASMEPFGHLVRQWCASMSFPCLWKCRQLLHETFDVVPANWHPWETSKHLTTGWSLNAIVTWWRSCALLLRWEHRSPRQGFRNLGTHCGPGQICSCLYIRLGYHKIVKTSVLRRKFLFFKKRPRIFPPNPKLQENGDRDRIFKNEMVYWDKQPFANLKGLNSCWIWSMCHLRSVPLLQSFPHYRWSCQCPRKERWHSRELPASRQSENTSPWCNGLNNIEKHNLRKTHIMTSFRTLLMRLDAHDGAHPQVADNI